MRGLGPFSSFPLLSLRLLRSEFAKRATEKLLVINEADCNMGSTERTRTRAILSLTLFSLSHVGSMQ